MSGYLKDLIKRILVPCGVRCTIDEILGHAWMMNEPNPVHIKLGVKNFNNYSKYSKVFFTVMKTKKLVAMFVASRLDYGEV